MVWERYCYASPKPEFFFIFFVYISIHISANMSPFRLKFSEMILHTETSKLMYNRFAQANTLTRTFKCLHFVRDIEEKVIWRACTTMKTITTYRRKKFFKRIRSAKIIGGKMAVILSKIHGFWKSSHGNQIVPTFSTLSDIFPFTINHKTIHLIS